MNPQQAWKANLEGALFFGIDNCKKTVWGNPHYLVRFVIRTIQGIALIETVLTRDPL